MSDLAPNHSQLLQPVIDLCGPDCWLKQDSQYQARVLPTSGFPAVDLPSPISVAKQLYRPLLSWQMRLVELEAAQVDEPLKCRLLTADIIHFEGVAIRETLQVVQYEALSYAWGDPNFTYPLRCNEMIYAITENLANALHSLRLPDKERLLWIDAICINQYDDDERASQVGKMFVIYQKAERVVAWLGKQLKWTFLAFNLINEGRTFRPKEHGLSCKVKEAHKALKEVYLRPWFRRTWIRQEVFAAQAVILKCGSLETNLRQVVDWEQEWLELQEKDQELAQTSTLLRILDVGASVGLTATDVLLGTLGKGTSFAASDPRDLVYGILGLIGGIDKPKENLWAERHPAMSRKIIVQIKEAIQAFPIDYSSTVSQVYQDVVKFTITQDKDLHSLCRYERQHRRADDIPTWAIDWREEVITNIFYLKPRPYDERRSSTMNGFSGFIGGGLLCLRGFRVGNLEHASPMVCYRRWGNSKLYKERLLLRRVLGSSEMDSFFLTDSFLTDGYCEAQIVYNPAVLDRMGVIAEVDEYIIPMGVSIPGDLVVYLLGGNDLFLLRPSLGNRFQFLGGVAVPNRLWNDIFDVAAEIGAETFILI